MNLDLDGRAFVVGGASRGIGRAIAGELVTEGARVLLVSRSEEAVAAAAADLGERASFLAADVADPGTAERVRARVEEEFGSLGGVVVNSGGPPPGHALELSDDAWRGAFELLIGGPIRLVRALVPLMGEGGSVLFVTSSSVRQPIPGLDASNVLRPGVAALAKSLARELGPRVRVNSLGPGRVDTDRVRSMDELRAGREGRSPAEVRSAAEAGIPLRRYGEADEIGRVGAFMLSGAASYMTGAAIQVDGGAVTAVP